MSISLIGNKESLPPRMSCHFDFVPVAVHSGRCYVATTWDTLVVGEERKRAAHSEACRTSGVTFIPLVVESLGNWSEETVDTVDGIGYLLGQ